MLDQTLTLENGEEKQYTPLRRRRGESSERADKIAKDLLQEHRK